MFKILILVLTLTFGLAFANNLDQKKGGRGCKNPKGKNGDTYNEGCTRYTCKSRKWKKENICSDMDISSSSFCSPACPIFAPFCKGSPGICVGGLLCLGSCSFSPSDVRNCDLAAAQTSSDECSTECNDATDTCQNCLLEKLPDYCGEVSYSSCFFCAKSILKAASQCLHNLTLACVKDHLSSSSCYSCICTIVCGAAGPDHALCKACSDDSDNSAHEFWPLIQTDSETSCPAKWVQSIETSGSKCYRVAPSGSGQAKVIQDQGAVTCRGIGGTLAIPDNAARQTAVASALKFSATKDCWLSGEQLGASDTWSWVPATGNPFPVSGSDFGQEGGCIDNTRPTPSCLYADENGMACNSPCQTSKCVVCEQDAS